MLHFLLFSVFNFIERFHFHNNSSFHAMLLFSFYGNNRRGRWKAIPLSRIWRCESSLSINVCHNFYSSLHTYFHSSKCSTKFYHFSLCPYLMQTRVLSQSGNQPNSVLLPLPSEVFFCNISQKSSNSMQNFHTKFMRENMQTKPENKMILFYFISCRAFSANLFTKVWQNSNF